MSVKDSLLALLVSGPKYGAQLRSEFEDRTSGAWPLNLGQVYTTMDRLERDGLVCRAGKAGHDGKLGYQLTDPGHDHVTAWFASPVERKNTPRDELTIKIALAVSVPGVDVADVTSAQRAATMTRLQRITKLKRTTKSTTQDLPWRLIVENLLYQTEAELRWLDHVEKTAIAEQTHIAQQRDQDSTESQVLS